MLNIGLILAGYLSGSLMLAKWLPALLFRTDIVTPSDDGNLGVFNAFRHGGLKCGVPALIGDVMKGFLPTFIAMRNADPTALIFGLTVAAPVIGHLFPAFTRFRGGGKGIAVSFGVALGLYPVREAFLLLAGLYIFFSTVAVVDTHLWRSVVTYNLFALLSLLFLPSGGIRLGCVMIGFLVAGKHVFARGDQPISLHLAWMKPRKR